LFGSNAILFDPLRIMGARRLSSTSVEFEQGRRIRCEEEDKAIVLNLQRAASDVTAALFALELIDESDTPRAELVSKASKLLSDVSEELQKALHAELP
jgi:hypothetical protein